MGAPLETNGHQKTGDIYKCPVIQGNCTKLNLGKWPSALCLSGAEGSCPYPYPGIHRVAQLMSPPHFTDEKIEATERQQLARSCIIFQAAARVPSQVSRVPSLTLPPINVERKILSRFPPDWEPEQQQLTWLFCRQCPPQARCQLRAPNHWITRYLLVCQAWRC